MKPIAFVPPAVALIIGGIWLGLQRRTTALLDQQSVLLETHIAHIRTTDQSDEAATASLPGTGSGTAKKAIDWKKVATQVAVLNENSGVGDMRAIMRLHEQISAMSEQELLAALDEIAALDLPKESLVALESMIAAQLAQKAPKAFLTRFLHRFGDQHGVMSWQLSNAFTTWAKKDQAAATAWFDRQIAAGSFDSKSLDGKSQPRLQFEGALVATLLASDPATAKNRIAGLPAEHRKEALRYIRGNSLDAAAPAYAEMVREQLPAVDQAQALAEAAPTVHAGDYGKVTDYLNQIAATPAEREACVEEAGQRTIQRLSYEREIKQEDLDRMREWAAKESPAMTDRTTGKALASILNRSGGMKFAQATDLALHYHEGGGGDELLLPLLDHWEAKQNADVARKLADRISDEKKREEILRKLNITFQR
jgi:hypothetical protein